MKIIAIIFDTIFTILALLLFLDGEYEMSILSCVLARLVRIEYKLGERK